MSQNLLVTLFSLVMIGNVVVLVRHWRLMQALRIILQGMVETQKQFNSIMEDEQRKRGLL